MRSNDLGKVFGKATPHQFPDSGRIPIWINPSRWVIMQNSKMSQMAPPQLSLERSTSINMRIPTRPLSGLAQELEG
jgi:hypothetical protein